MAQKHKVHFELYPAPHDITSLAHLFTQLLFYKGWHPLMKETNHLALRAASAKVSYSFGHDCVPYASFFMNKRD